MNEFLQSWFDAQNWRELTRVSLEPPPHTPFRAATAFLAVLAFPDDTGQRDRFMMAAHAFVRTRLNMRHGMRPRDVGRVLNRCGLRINTRLRAAYFAQRVMIEVASPGMTIEASRSIREAIFREGDPFQIILPLSVIPPKDVARIQRVDSQPRYPRPPADGVDTNIIRDVWSPSLPVLPMAMALNVHPDFARPLPSIDEMILDPTWVRFALENLPLYAMALWKKDLVTPEQVVMLQGS